MYTLLVRLTSGAAIVENNLAIIQNVIEVSHDPTLPLLGIYPKEMKVLGHMYIHFHSDMIHNSQKVETMQMSINGRMDKHIRHIHKNGLLLSL